MKTILLMSVCVSAMFFASFKVKAQDANFSNVEVVQHSHVIVAGNFSWNRSLVEDIETDPETDQPLTFVKHNRSAVLINKKEPELLMNKDEVLREGLYADAAVNHVYMERMNKQVEHYEYTLRMMDSLNNRQSISPAVWAINTSGVSERNDLYAKNHEYTLNNMYELNHTSNNRVISEKIGMEVNNSSVVATTINFAVVLGSFHVAENAERFNETLQKKGYLTEVVFANEVRKHRVLIKADSKADALAIRKGLRSTLSDVWVWMK